jgi:nucleotide-binding universal stress UspA family protein
MRIPRRILACTDFSPGSAEAVAYAIELAAAIHAEVVLAHLFDGAVMMPRELFRPPGPTALAARRELGLAQLRELARSLWRDGVAIHCVCEHGDARTEIPRLAQRERADLIVVGRFGQSGISRLFMGSVTDAIVRNASVPVLAVGDGDHVAAHAEKVPSIDTGG